VFFWGKPMKIKILAIMAVMAALLSANLLLGAGPGDVIFCESVSDKLEPVGQNTEFNTNQVSIMAYKENKEAFGVLSVILSIYIQRSEEGQEIIHRETAEINPDWNVIALENIPLPEVGTFYVTINAPSGDLLSKGLVEIKEKTVEKEIPAENVIEGASLASIFEAYKSTAVTTE
jgi:hypothetical protein